MRSARSSLAHAAKEFRAAGDRPNAALVEALIAFVEAENARTTLAIGEAHVAASKAWAAAHRAGHAPLAKEVERFEAALDAPVARLSSGRSLDIAAVAEIHRAKKQIVVDGRRGAVFLAGSPIADLASRPPLLALLSALAEVAPRSISSRDLARKVLGAKAPNASHDAKVRAQVSRLRKLIGKKLGDFVYEDGSFRWEARFPVVVLTPVVSSAEARLEALFSDGRLRAARIVARDLGESASATNKVLTLLAKKGTIRSTGQGPTKKWMAASSASAVAMAMVLAASTGRA